MRRLVLTLLLAGSLRAGEFPKEPLKATEDESDRVVAELSLFVKSDTLPSERTDKFYFVPISTQTAAEKKQLGALVQAGEINFEPSESWLYTAFVRVESDRLVVKISGSKKTAAKAIERATEFSVPLFEDSEGQRAGITYTIKWKNSRAQAAR